MLRTAMVFGSTLLALLGLGGCSSDCNLACTEAAKCVVVPTPTNFPPEASNIDVCTSLCENAVDDDDGVSEDDVADCAECVEEASCSELVGDGDCDEACAGIPGVNVPPAT